MKSSTLLLFFICGCYLVSCTKDDPNTIISNGVAVKLPHLWETPRERPTLGGIVVKTPIVYDTDKVLIGSAVDGATAIFSLDSKTGSILWKWSDLFTNSKGAKDDIYIRNLGYHLFDNKLFFTSYSNSYCIDLLTGRTLWKYRVPDRYRRDINGGVGYNYITVGADVSTAYNEALFMGDLRSPNEEKLLLVPDYTPVPDKPDQVGFVTIMKCFTEKGNDYIAFGIENPSIPSLGGGMVELNLFNLTTNQYVYKKVPLLYSLNKQYHMSGLEYQGGRLYATAGKWVYCFEAFTGIQIWNSYLTNGYDNNLLIDDGNFIIAGSKLVFTKEDYSTYCVETTTGNVDWKMLLSPSRFNYLNGILYTISDFDSPLAALEVDTGKYLWKLEAPDYDGFTICVVVPGQNGAKGKIIASTDYNVFAYEAVK